MRILVTGAAGFIGYHLCEKLISLGHDVIGIDNINDYYDVNLKFSRMKQLGIDNNVDWNKEYRSSLYDNYTFFKMDLCDKENLPKLFNENNFDVVCNLAAQPGVRYSLENPMAYVDSNLVGFVNLLECVRHYSVKRLVYASSSSVYGLNKKVPFSTDDNVDHPISLYAATKKSNELMSYTYSHLYNFQTVGLRFFTVYGPWGRPDMAMFLFTDAILKDKPIKVFNNGNLSRDFTYIDDIVEGVVATIENKNKRAELYSLYNIGNGTPVKLLDYIEEIERATGKTAIKEMMPMQPGDVEQTWADTEALHKVFNYKPLTTIQVGIKTFVEWYKKYYKK